MAALLFSWACQRGEDPQAVSDRIAATIGHGDLRAASAQVDEALAKFGPKSPEWSWRFRILKARIFVFQLAPKKALNLLREQLPAELASTDIVISKNMVEGMAYRVAQDFERSGAKFAIAENLASQSQMPILCEVLNRRGALEFDLRKYSDAATYYQRALELSKQFKRRDQEASALASLARVAVIQERFDEGIDRGQKALELSESLDLRGLAETVRGNLGWSYFQLGDFETARDHFKEAAAASQRLGLTGYGFYWQGFLAQTYQKLNDNDSAKALLLQTVDDARKLDNKQTMTENLNYLVRLALKTDQLDDAARYNREALLIEEAGQDHFGVLETKLLAGRIAVLRREFSSSAALLRQVIQDPAAETFLKWEAEEALAEMHDAESQPKLAEAEYRKAIHEFESKRSTIERDDLRLSFIARGMDSYNAYINFLIHDDRPVEALKLAEQSRARTLEEGLEVKNRVSSETHRGTPPQEIARQLKATLMFYWIGERKSYLWVITPRKTDSLELAKSGDIEPVVRSYRKAILGMRDAQGAGATDGKKLYAMLVEPAKKLIPKGSRVILLPAESLYGLNFETLVVPDPQPHFWIEDVTLTTANSLTLLASSAKRFAPREKGLLLVGNTEPNASFPALAQAAVEIQKIEHYFPDQNRKVLEGRSATPTAYLNSGPEKFAYLHFVTHGTASITRPLESAVILSSEGDSYKLYARDIVKHRLNAHLVTISACDGLGKRTYSGEGLVGLSWAFLRAGAHNVIGALWEVSDASTPQLMDALYNGLSQGKDPATALRDAKLSLLHSNSDTVFKKPFYWAPFQLYAGS